MSEPKKRHFFAQFHLATWAEQDGRIPTYQRVGDGSINLLQFSPGIRTLKPTPPNPC